MTGPKPALGELPLNAICAVALKAVTLARVER